MDNNFKEKNQNKQNNKNNFIFCLNFLKLWSFQFPPAVNKLFFPQPNKFSQPILSKNEQL